MADIKLAYIGGGSTRAPGTLASFVQQGENFRGSEIVLVDLDPERLDVVCTLARKMARAKDLDLRISSTTDRRAALADCDAVLTSFRPGGFGARYLDESIPLRHGVIGQETQGPGGFFMALRSIHVMRGIVRDMEEMCPSARLFNYTNPVNIVSQAIVLHSDIATVSLCEGPIIFPRMVARAAGLDPDGVDAVMIGLNHACWSVRHEYRGRDMVEMIRKVWSSVDPDGLSPHERRLLQMTATAGAIPADYFQYYYYRDEIREELRSRRTTRAQDIMSAVPGYWSHYREQAASDVPELDPRRSRGGINELELAIDVMDAVFNDRREVWPVNIPNGTSIPDLPPEAVVELPGLVDARGVRPIAQPPLPDAGRGLVNMLAEYQLLTARAAWAGSRDDALRALIANPLVPSIPTAVRLYSEMSAALAQYLPDRLLR